MLLSVLKWNHLLGMLGGHATSPRTGCARSSLPVLFIEYRVVRSLAPTAAIASPESFHPWCEEIPSAEVGAEGDGRFRQWLGATRPARGWVARKRPRISR